MILKTDNVKEKQTILKGVEPTMVVGPSHASEVNSEKSFSLIMDRDLTSETWYYLQVKRAKVSLPMRIFLMCYINIQVYQMQRSR